MGGVGQSAGSRGSALDPAVARAAAAWPLGLRVSLIADVADCLLGLPKIRRGRIVSCGFHRQPRRGGLLEPWRPQPGLLRRQWLGPRDESLQSKKPKPSRSTLQGQPLSAKYFAACERSGTRSVRSLPDRGARASRCLDQYPSADLGLRAAASCYADRTPPRDSGKTTQLVVRWRR